MNHYPKSSVGESSERNADISRIISGIISRLTNVYDSLPRQLQERVDRIKKELDELLSNSKLEKNPEIWMRNVLKLEGKINEILGNDSILSRYSSIMAANDDANYRLQA